MHLIMVSAPTKATIEIIARDNNKKLFAELNKLKACRTVITLVGKF
jgi:hypothetical protein